LPSAIFFLVPSELDPYLTSLLNLLSNNLRHKLLHQLLQVTRNRLLLNNLKHLLANRANLSRGGIGSLSQLVLSLLGECDGKDTNKVPVGSLDIHVCLNKGLPLFNERSKLVGSEIHAVKVCETVLSGDFLDLQLDLAETVFHVVVEVGEGDFEDTVFEVVLCVFWVSFEY
jgi:hypothetical protein